MSSIPGYNQPQLAIADDNYFKLLAEENTDKVIPEELTKEEEEEEEKKMKIIKKMKNLY